MRTCFIAICGLALVLVQGIGASAESLKVFAAASLKSALDRALAGYEERGDGDAVAVYGASGALAKQIAEGAPADVFVSADPAWVDVLAKQNVTVAGSREAIFGNRLVLVAPVGTAAKLDVIGADELAGALKGGKLAMCNLKACPAGQYGRSALTALGAWDAVASHVVQADNVRAALAFVALGEAALGVVYATDAAAEPAVEIAAAFPASSHKAIVYEAVAIAGDKAGAAVGLIAFLKGPDGRKPFLELGFTLLP